VHPAARTALAGLCALALAGAPSALAHDSLVAADARPATSAAAPALDPEAALERSQAAIGRKLRDYAFLDRERRLVRLSDYRGRPLLVSYIYTGCTSACPTSIRSLAHAVRRAQAVVGAGRFRVVTIGFDPPHDSPEAMREFALRHGIGGPEWEFLVPQPAELDALLSDLGFSAVRTSWGFDHIAQVTVVDQQGRIYRQVYGDDFPIRLLVDPLKELIEGAPEPVRGLSDLLERVRLLCTVYDPRTNTYRFKTSVIGEIVSFGAITIALVWFLWYERKRRREPRGGPGAAARARAPDPRA
jgi:protein SCO1/2